MRILGIDPGTGTTGYGIIEKRGNRLLHIDNGAIHTSSAEPLSLRLKTIYDQLAGVISEFAPQAVAVEQIFVSRNALSALKLGHARGAAILAGVSARLPVFEYSALQVKSAVVGHGKAQKSQVQEMIRILMKLPEKAQEDASDALAVAICHAHSHALKDRLQNAAGKR